MASLPSFRIELGCLGKPSKPLIVFVQLHVGNGGEDIMINLLSSIILPVIAYFYLLCTSVHV